MIRAVFVMCTLIVMCHVNAQENKELKRKSFRFGLKAGLNLATITQVDRAKTLSGINAGGLVEFRLSEKFTLQPEMLYSGQGTKLWNRNYTIDYLIVPMMFKYYPVAAFNLELGPQVGILLSSQPEESYFTYYNDFDLCFNLGAGYNFNQDVFFGIRYNLGLVEAVGVPSNCGSFDCLDFDFADGPKNSVWQFSLGYKF